MRLLNSLIKGVLLGFLLFGVNFYSVKFFTYICDKNIGNHEGMIRKCLSDELYESKTEKYFKFILNQESNDKINSDKIFHEKVKEIYITCEILEKCEIKKYDKFYLKNRVSCIKEDERCLNDLLLYWKNKSVVNINNLDINCEKEITEIKNYLKINDIINCNNYKLSKIYY